jgi:hypothetical protein
MGATIRHAAATVSVSSSAPTGLYLLVMSTFFTIMLFLAMAATAGALVWGVIAMARGGDFNAKWSNRMMQYRVLFQAIALAFFVVLLMLAKD